MYANSVAAMTGRSASWLAACRAVTVTWQACHYLVDLCGMQLVTHIRLVQYSGCWLTHFHG